MCSQWDMGDALVRISLTDKGISIIIHNYLIDTCTGIFHGLHCHCNWWARFVISYFDTCPIDKEQQQQQQQTSSSSTFTILSLTTNPLKLHLSQTTLDQLRRKKIKNHSHRLCGDHHRSNSNIYLPTLLINNYQTTKPPPTTMPWSPTSPPHTPPGGLLSPQKSPIDPPPPWSPRRRRLLPTSTTRYSNPLRTKRYLAPFLTFFLLLIIIITSTSMSTSMSTTKMNLQHRPNHQYYSPTALAKNMSEWISKQSSQRLKVAEMKLRGTWKGYQEGEFEVKNPLVGVEVGGFKGEKEDRDGREGEERKGVLRVEYPEERVGNPLMGMGKEDDNGARQGEVVVV